MNENENKITKKEAVAFVQMCNENRMSELYILRKRAKSIDFDPHWHVDLVAQIPMAIEFLQEIVDALKADK